MFSFQEGHFLCLNLKQYKTMPCGNSHIITSYAETVRQGIDDESQKLETKIQRYKDNIMDEPGKEFYENTIAMRRTMIESL